MPCLASGVLLVNKPEDTTSTSVVNYCKKILKPRKIGHAGTLDPFASGLLPICLNEATKIFNHIIEQEKIYEATFKLGEETDTGDRDGTIISRSLSDVHPPSEEEIQLLHQSFTGTFWQDVPKFSAAKHQGKPLYWYARQNIDVPEKKKRVTIKEFQILSYEYPWLRVLVRCSHGTYLRSLARDVGRYLKVGAHLISLQRNGIGEYQLEQAVPLDQITETLNQGFIPLGDCLREYRALILKADSQWESMLRGVALAQGAFSQRSSLRLGDVMKILTPSGHLAAIVKVTQPGSEINFYSYMRVFQPEKIALQ